MARVTVEDCVQKVPNRYELVLLAAQRARNLSRGEELTLDRDNDKNPVGAVFSWDAFEDRDMVCGTCYEVIHELQEAS